MEKRIKYLLKIGELALKGGNRKLFEKLLRDNIRKALSGYSPSVSGGYGRFFLTVPLEHAEKAEEVLSSTFGLTAYVRCIETEKSVDAILDGTLWLADECLAKYGKRFKIEARRTDKKFSKNSYEMKCLCGESISVKFPDAVVDVRKPEWIINLEIRESVYLYGPVTYAPGGLPSGMAGKGILLLSGGIDSPVAGYMMAKRGLELEGLYFHAYPYTSDEALDKVKQLAARLARYNKGFILHIVNFTALQLKLKEKGKENELTLYMRAAMMSIAGRIAEKRGALALVTGESLSQVASQTAMSIRYTNSYTDYPVFRPLIGLDKEEIIRKAKDIGTYGISILPYEDCCTLFSPKNPKTRPRFEETRAHFSALDIDVLIHDCINGIRSEKITI